MNKNKPVLIYVLPRSPWPPYAGQSRLAFFRAKELKKKGYKIILIYFSISNSMPGNGSSKLKSVFHEIHHIPIDKIDFFFIFLTAVVYRLLFKLPLQTTWLNSQRIIYKFSRKISYIEKKYKKTLYHFYSIRSKALWSIAEKNKKPFVIDLVDSMTLNLERKCSITKNLKKIFWIYELNAIRIFEQNLPFFHCCKKYLVVSKIDKDNLKINSPKRKDFISVNNIGYKIPSNLDKLKYDKGANKKIIFFGSLSYEPNLNALIWLIKNVLPIVWKEDPNIIVKIAGSNPTDRLKNLCKKYENIKLIANPISMRKHIRKSTLSVAPLISGSGQQFKIIESMSYGIPVISTQKGANPFGFKQNKEIIIANDSESFAKAILSLSNDPKKMKFIRRNAFLTIKNKFSWEKSVEKLEKNIYL